MRNISFCYVCVKGECVIVRLKELRERRHMSQVFLGMELNISQNAISQYETGIREADYKTMIAIADYFDVSLDYLFGRTENPNISR